jgi:uncharacterized protein (DUF1778 family)
MVRMDITPYVDSLRRDLLAAADGAGEETRRAAERLGYALDPAARLAMMEAISQAAAEITAAMPVGGVDVRLDGRDLDFLVSAADEAPEPEPAPAPVDAKDEDTVRITLRLPESVKADAEAAAAAAGQSLNTWLVAAVRSATSTRGIRVDLDLSSLPFGSGPGRAGPQGKRRMTGWI